MSWLSNYVRPKIRAVLRKQETSDNLWHKCKGCGQLIFLKDFESQMQVCSHCGHHARISADQRLKQLFDGGVFTEISVAPVADDPLKFRDAKKYTDRLKERRAATGHRDALTAATGNLGGLEVVIAVQDFAFMAGSMGIGVGTTFIAAVHHAVAHKQPLVMVTAAGGARMQEGILALMQMPRTTVAVETLREAGLPYIVLLTDPTTGGVTASYAMLGDVAIAEPGALIGFAGPRVIENTIHEKLPEGFQRSEYLLDHGIIDMVVQRKDLRAALIRVIGLLLDRPVQAAEYAEPAK